MRRIAKPNPITSDIDSITRKHADGSGLLATMQGRAQNLEWSAVMPLATQLAKSIAMLLAALVWLITAPGARLALALDAGSQAREQDLAAPPDSEQSEPDNGASTEAPYARLSNAQLERLVAPIALYPDALVAQILVASTFPSQITDAEGWLQIHPGLSGADLGKQVDQQSWDPSVKALVQYPSVLANLSKNLGWTSELGDAYYNQPDDLMKAVQEMRKKAKKAGNLQPTAQLNVQEDDGRIAITPVDPRRRLCSRV